MTRISKYKSIIFSSDSFRAFLLIVFDFRYPVAPPQSTGPFAGGSVPPTPIVGASGERSAAAGSDRKDIPPNPVSALPANVAPPVGRNVTGSGKIF